MSKPSRDELSQEEVFDLLSSPRRRFVLYYLRGADEPIELGELANEVAAWENETEVSELTSQQRKRVYVSLYQTHIPKLEEFGVIDYDPESGLVRPTDQVQNIGQYLQTENEQVQWGMYYLMLALASVVFYASIAFDLISLSPIAELVSAGVVFLAFLVLTSVHWLSMRRQESRGLREVVERE